MGIWRSEDELLYYHHQMGMSIINRVYLYHQYFSSEDKLNPSSFTLVLFNAKVDF